MRPPAQFLDQANELLGESGEQVVRTTLEDPGMLAYLDQQEAAIKDAGAILAGAVEASGEPAWRVTKPRQLAFVMAMMWAFTEACDVMCPHAVDVLVMGGGARPLVADLSARTCACPACAPLMPSFGFRDPQACALCGGVVTDGRQQLEATATIPPGVVASAYVCADCWSWAS